MPPNTGQSNMSSGPAADTNLFQEAGEKVRAALPSADKVVNRGRTHIADLDTRFRALVDGHPIGTLAGAFAIGYLIARVARR